MNPLPQIEWIRPHWLWAVLPLLVLAWHRWRSVSPKQWEDIVDPLLQPYVIEGGAASSRWLAFLPVIAWLLAIVLLAGPVWQKREVPLVKAVRSQVVMFDLSRSMLADDLAPDRATRARFKLLELLRQGRGLQTGLIGFAERPYVISPLTDDVATIEAFVPSLSPEIVPVQGSRVDLAIDRGVSLLQQAGLNDAHLILISDATADDRSIMAAARARAAGYHVSVLSVGTPGGAPLRGDQGQFFRDDNGSIVMARLDIGSHQTLAATGGGVAVLLDASNRDIEALYSLTRRLALEQDEASEEVQRVYWIEQAPWLLWLLVLLVLLGFRRGVGT